MKPINRSSLWSSYVVPETTVNIPMTEQSAAPHMAESKYVEITGTEDHLQYDRACKEIARRICEIHESKLPVISIILRQVSSEFHLNHLPRRHDLMKYLPDHQRDMLRIRPVRTASGVTIVTVMATPYPCPQGRCIYCPGGVEFNTPMSYVGSEPATKIAQTHSYDPYEQITTKLKTLRTNGHDTGKIELIILGGTFPFMPRKYQSDFVKACYDALNSDVKIGLSHTLEEAMSVNELSNHKCVGLTIETKPDYCKQNHIDLMLSLGVTRVEIGVQSLRNEVLSLANRGHNVDDVIESFRIARNAGLKIVAHMMPGLPNSSPKKDLEDLQQIMYDPRYKPDMLKIYPTLVLRNTGLHKLYSRGQFVPYTDEEMVRILVELKKKVPPWIRIMRIQREIETKDIIAGPKKGNLRQLALERLYSEGHRCKCIRCREIGLRTDKWNDKGSTKLTRLDYEAAEGQEIFLCCETQNSSALLGFLRLRKVTGSDDSELHSYNCHNDNTVAVVRELHVYGQALSVGRKANGMSSQHRGIGKVLMAEAEQIAKSEFGVETLSVISAVGTRKYYGKLGYSRKGYYVTKLLK
ncbi:MAG TPA: tRNA uridine(34) 5-carboxymethylaminomethyl modification radical SAM/GNAT enzyme Elp3 [Nitrososphaeraceae archaeon]|nr:tRNA uridine(34) 5-carboxymethylaminomethyl modification radical SAM/GNAT enzyme Elp3 [Nitrososphaeraceae archaeon]